MPYFKILIASCFLAFLFHQSSYSQRQDAVWCFGDSIMVKFDSTITVSNQAAVNSIECSASISDKQGNLLFYVSGYNQGSFLGKIWDSTNNIMQNGDSIALFSSSTNGAIIIPFPNDSNKYYIITQSWFNLNYGDYSLLYHVVDLSRNNGLGEVITKNQYLTTDSCAEKLLLIRHGNGKDWWLVYHSATGNKFFASLIDSTGIHFPLQFNIGTNYIMQNSPFVFFKGETGEMISSQNGEFIAAVGTGIIDLFDFDRCTGSISNYQNLFNGNQFADENQFYGCSFSMNARFFYVSNVYIQSPTSNLFQFDLLSPNIISSSQTICSIPSSNFTFGQHQLAPNGKIYITRCKDSFPTNNNDSVNTYLSLINVPDSSGIGCEFALNSLYLNGGRTYLGLPNMPNYNLGRLIGSACDTITGIAETNNANIDFKVFPNPSIGKFEITFSKNKFNNTSFVLNVFSIEGKLLKQQIENVLNAKATIDLSAFSNGVYFLEIKSDDANFAFRKKLMIEK